MLLHKDKSRTANLSDLLEGLSEAGIEFIVVGGLAAVIQGAPVTTMVLEIVHRQTKDNIDRLLNFLKKKDAFYRRPDDKRIEPDEYLLSTRPQVFLLYVLNSIRNSDPIFFKTYSTEFKNFSYERYAEIGSRYCFINFHTISIGFSSGEYEDKYTDQILIFIGINYA